MPRCDVDEAIRRRTAMGLRPSASLEDLPTAQKVRGMGIWTGMVKHDYVGESVLGGCQVMCGISSGGTETTCNDVAVHGGGEGEERGRRRLRRRGKQGEK